MFEIALCVMAYVVVLWIEFAPAFLERCGLTGIKRFLDRWMFVFAALGVLLPTMHQSSLGSMLLVMGYKLSPLWFTLWLPALFVISALAMGYAVVMFEATVVSQDLLAAVRTRLDLENVDRSRLDHGRLAGVALWRSVRARRRAARLRRQHQRLPVLGRERSCSSSRR